MHFKDKEREKLYKNLLKTLKPGGKLMVSDYCRGEKPSPQVILPSGWLRDNVILTFHWSAGVH